MHTKRGIVKDLICTPEAYSLVSLCEKPTRIKALIYKRFCTEQQYRYFVLRDRGRRRARSSMKFEYLKGGWIYMNTKNIYSNKQYWKSYDPCSSKLFLSHSKLLPCHITMVYFFFWSYLHIYVQQANFAFIQNILYCLFASTRQIAIINLSIYGMLHPCLKMPWPVWVCFFLKLVRVKRTWYSPVRVD